MTIKERYRNIIDLLIQFKPLVKTELVYHNPFELLVATILSAQCSDKRVNIITPDLLRKYPDAKAFSQANYTEIFEAVKSCSYPNSKAKHLVEMSKMLVSEYDGNVPSEIDQLLELPGVGRKTANVILAVAFDKPAMAVDTHVFRVTARIGLTFNSKTPESTEKELIKHIPANLLNVAHNWFILHGRYICTARKPKCNECSIKNLCLYYSDSIK
jgi:endonuclease III